MRPKDRTNLHSAIADGEDVWARVADLTQGGPFHKEISLYLDKDKPGFVSACQGQIDPHTGACNNWLFDIPDPLGHLAGKLLLD